MIGDGVTHICMMMQALPCDGKLVALDRDEKTLQIARKFWKKAGVMHKVGAQRNVSVFFILPDSAQSPPSTAHADPGGCSMDLLCPQPSRSHKTHHDIASHDGASKLLSVPSPGGLYIRIH